VKLVPIAVSRFVGRNILIAQKNSPALMLGAGIGVGILATVKACQATLNLEQVLAEAEKDAANLDKVVQVRPDKYPADQHEMYKRALRIRTARNVAKLYAPAVGLGVVSVVLLTGSHVVLTKRNAGLAAAYAVLDKGFNEYRDRVRSELGPEKDQEFRYGSQTKEVVTEGKDGHEIREIKRNAVTHRSIYARYFDETNRNWQRSSPIANRTFVQVQQDYANDKLTAQGHLFLNEVYDLLGMERTPEGSQVGWIKNGKHARDGVVDFCLDWGSPAMRDFMNGDEGSVLLDFNVDGVMWNLI
jgi:hypothetical protein